MKEPSMPLTRRLFHYTCEHHWQGIMSSRLIMPGRLLDIEVWNRERFDPRIAMVLNYVWMTDIPDVITDTAAQVGLTNETLACDRTEYRFEVTDLKGIKPFSMVRLSGDMEQVAIRLAQTPGACPENWFVSEIPVPVRLSMGGRVNPSIMIG